MTTGSASVTQPLERWSQSSTGHVVQFYSEDPELVSRVAGLLLSVVDEGDVAIVVATPAHRRGVQKRLAEAGVDVLAAVENGTFRFLDADQTMRRFLVEGWPDAGGFDSVIGGLLRQASQTGRPIRVFGEMVALLWEAGQVNAALELEALWNDLARQLPFSLFCAYPKHSMTGEDIDAFAQVCGLHTAVVPGAEPAHPNAATNAPSLSTTTPAHKPAAMESGRAQARERILATADTLFSRRGVHKVGVDELITSSGVAKATFYRHFPSKDDLVLAFLDRSEQRWTHELIEAGAQRRGTTPEQRLLAVFDVLDESFNRPDDFEGCTFINVLLEMGASHPLGQASIGYLDNLRGLARRWASEAGLAEVDAFARCWHILVTGSIISASEGDRSSAGRARQMAQLLIEQHRPGSRQTPNSTTAVEI